MTYCPHDDDPLSCPPCQGAGAPRTLRRRTHPVTVLARFDSTCAACGDPVIAGEDDLVLDLDDNAWIHERCTEVNA